jgi:putative FmdB family regulatory protein
MYEYQCEKCGKRVDIIQRSFNTPFSHCPNCGGDMKKLISAPAIQFRGSGFYKTDYASASSKPPEGSGPAEGSKSETKSEKMNETKNETKSETKSEKKSETKSE